MTLQSLHVFVQFVRENNSMGPHYPHHRSQIALAALSLPFRRSSCKHSSRALATTCCQCPWVQQKFTWREFENECDDKRNACTLPRERNSSCYRRPPPPQLPPKLRLLLTALLQLCKVSCPCGFHGAVLPYGLTVLLYTTVTVTHGALATVLWSSP